MLIVVNQPEKIRNVPGKMENIFLSNVDLPKKNV